MKKLLQSMLESKCYDINVSDNAGRIGLKWVSKLGHERTVHILLDKVTCELTYNL
jgi:hypothetical protein